MFSSQLYPPVNKKRGVQKKFLLASLADCTPHFQIPGVALGYKGQEEAAYNNIFQGSFQAG